VQKRSFVRTIWRYCSRTKAIISRDEIRLQELAPTHNWAKRSNKIAQRCGFRYRIQNLGGVAWRPLDDMAIAQVKALVFDTFGTVVDWRSSIVAECRPLAASKGLSFDPEAFADA